MAPFAACILSFDPRPIVWEGNVDIGCQVTSSVQADADYATIYFDMSILNSTLSPEAHEAELKRLIDAGFGARMMFGSDTRPAAPILRRLENIKWLTPEQRKAILYDNAARFLRLDPETIARHYGR